MKLRGLLAKQKLSSSSNFILFFIVFLVFCNNLLWMLSLPYNAAPDEEDHYRICRFIAKEERLPVFLKDLPVYWMDHFTKQPISEEEIAFVNQLPPSQVPSYLFNIRYFPEILAPHFSYVMAALFMKFVGIFTANTFFYLLVGRFWSVICGCLTVWMTFKIAKKIFPQEPYVVMLSGIFVGFLPQFTFISAYLNQDAFTALASSVMIFSLLKCIELWDVKHAAFLGCSLGLVLLSKMNSYPVIILPIIALPMLMKERGRQGLYPLFILIVCLGLVSGWALIHNLITYGQLWPLDLGESHSRRIYAETSPQITHFAILHPLILSDFGEVKRFFWDTFISFWGLFGWMEILMPKFFYTVCQVLSLVAVIGFIRLWRRKIFFDFAKITGKNIFLFSLFLPVIIMAMMMVQSSNSTFNPQGRFLFPVIAPLAIVFACGWLSLVKGDKSKRIIFILLTGALVTLNFSAFLLSVVDIYYYRSI